MGWTHCQNWKSKDQVVEMIMEGRKGPSAMAWEGGTWVHWSVATLRDGNEIICCYLIEPSAQGWGYKGMDECMGPYYYSCPLEFLERTDGSPYKNEKWRLEVLKRRAAA
jgi:hypothetical protein